MNNNLFCKSFAFEKAEKSTGEGTEVKAGLPGNVLKVLVSEGDEVKAGDVVIAKMMPAGRAILCPNYDVKYVLSSDAVKFVLPVGICNDYVLNAINSSVFREQVYDNVQGVTRVRTSLQKLRTYVLPIPPYNEQLRIVSKVRELFSQIDMIEKSLQA